MQFPVSLALFVMLATLLGALLAVHYANKRGSLDWVFGPPAQQAR